MIPNFNFLYFLSEMEWKIKKNLTYDEKLQNYFDMQVVKVGEPNIFDVDFLNNEDLNMVFD